MANTTTAATVPTRLLILSDTHGKDFSAGNRPHQRADVALHCGDITDGSTLEEFRTSIQMLGGIDAPLKLIIAGNHDFTLDTAAFEAKIADAVPPLEPEDVAEFYGLAGQARQLLEDARSKDIVFLDEGTHRFLLDNGAALTVYASPYTPALGAWGFQYHPNRGHRFDIQEHTDIVMTHGPPRGIMDYSHGRERAGCSDLFGAVANARPRIHCFGHIHEGWGARVVTWKDGGMDQPSHFTAINNEYSPVIEKLATLRPGNFDSDEGLKEKRARLEQLEHSKCAVTRHCMDDQYPLLAGRETLFINAAIEGQEEFVQRPWLVDIELPRGTQESRVLKHTA